MFRGLPRLRQFSQFQFCLPTQMALVPNQRLTGLQHRCLREFRHVNPPSGTACRKGSGCFAGWAANYLVLDAATQFATAQGQALFGENFHIANSMSFSSSIGTLTGGLDVVLPLTSSTLPSAAASQSGAFFLQHGMTRWVDDRGLGRNDVRFGAVRRFDLSKEDAAPGILGISAFVQQNREFQHTRLVAGTDYGGRWGRGSLKLFIPTTGWKATVPENQERALAGIDLGLELDLTTTLSMGTAVGRWEKEDGLGGWSTNGRMTVAWRPHEWLDIGMAWNAIGTLIDDKTIRVGFSMPLGGTHRRPEWEGLGISGGGPGRSALDAWAPVDDIGVIQVARRVGESNQPFSEATVRFLQDSANTGDQIRVEVRLSATTSTDVNLIVTLVSRYRRQPGRSGSGLR